MHCPRCGSKIPDSDFVCIKCGYMEEIAIIAKLKEVKPETENLADLNLHYAGFWKRLLALIIDFAILIFTELIIVLMISGVIFGISIIGKKPVDMQVIHEFSWGFAVVLAIALNWAYFTGFESSSRQATYGKMIFGIKVTDKKGRQISLARANFRYWTKIISLLVLFFGFIMVAFSKKKRALHDIIAGTVVLTKSNENI